MFQKLRLLILKVLKPFPRLYAWLESFYLSTIGRARNSPKYVTSQLFKRLSALRKLILANNLHGGLITQDGEFYLKSPRGLFMFYNFSDSQLEPGDGRNQNFRQEIGGVETIPAILDAVMQNGNVYFDVGANNGYVWSLHIARKYPSSTVFAFEPNPKIIQHLRKNVSINKLDNVQVVSEALTDYVGQARLAVDLGLNSLNSYLVRESRTLDATVVNVPCNTLDHFVEEAGITQIDAIKVDVEGGELGFLKGAKAVLRTFAPVLILELHEQFLKRSGASERKVLNLLQELDYEVYRVEGTGDALAVSSNNRKVIKDFATQVKRI
jgi:FkbM family methyltransferase